MKQMAAIMRTRGGSRDTARQMYRQMLTDADDQQSRSLAELRLMELDSLDQQDAINEKLKEAGSAGRCPASLKEIIHRLADVKLPNNESFRINAAGDLVDPTGEPYRLDTAKCVAALGVNSKIPPPLDQ